MTRLVLLLALALFPSFACAGDGLVICDNAYISTHPMSWETLRPGYAKALADGRYFVVTSDLMRRLEHSAAQIDLSVKAKMMDRIRQVIEGKVECCADFAPRYESPAEAYLPGRHFLFGKEIDLDQCEGGRAAQNDELRYLAENMVNVGNAIHEDHRAASVRSMAELEKRYDRMLFEGFPMMPWEAWVNSRWLTPNRIVDGPPHHVAVFMHPSLGTSLGTARLADAKLGMGMAVEPAGWVFYPPKAAHRAWWGVSTLAFFRGDLGLGVGVLGRYRHFSVGVVWHDGNKDNRLSNDRGSLFLGMDLYEFLGKTLRGYHGYLEEVAEGERQNSE
jgi:hypothetical protein